MTTLEQRSGRVLRRFAAIATVALAPTYLAGCGSSDPTQVAGEHPKSTTSSASDPVSSFPSTYLRQWMTNLANSVRVDGITPPIAARTYAYGAIAMWEAVVHGIPGARSFAGQLNGLTSLPQPDSSATYDWPTVLAATMQEMVKPDTGIYVYPNLAYYDFVNESRTSLGTLGPAQIGYRQVAGVPQDVLDRSVDFGTQLGTALTTWARADGWPDKYRYMGFIPPKCDGCWVPTGFGDMDRVTPPLEPHFGDVRPLVMTDGGECDPGPPPTFSTDPTSQLYQQEKAVYDTDQNLNIEQRTIALFWADGAGTATPPGHWLTILNTFIRSENLADAVKKHALLSIGFMDSFIAVWNTKFKYNQIRPETYIRRYIDPNWRPLIPTPQFPDWTSGHSGQSGASTAILASFYGDIPFSDTTKRRRGFGTRSFPSFSAAADEVAVSRQYGGIHIPLSNAPVGLAVGHCVSDKVLERVHLE